jgi:hypothetical protein
MPIPNLQLSSRHFTSRTVAECSSEAVAAAVVHCFQGYLVPMLLTPERYEARFRAENLDPLIVARLSAKDGEPDLPWMLMPETLAPSLFLSAGWKRKMLNQFEMKLEF